MSLRLSSIIRITACLNAGTGMIRLENWDSVQDVLGDLFLLPCCLLDFFH